MVLEGVKRHAGRGSLARSLFYRRGARQFVVYWHVILSTFPELLGKIKRHCQPEER